MKILILLLVPLLMAFLAPVTQAGNGGIESGYYSGGGLDVRVDVVDTPDGPMVTVTDVGANGSTSPTPLLRDGDGVGRAFLAVITNGVPARVFRGRRYRVEVWRPETEEWICLRRRRNVPPPPAGSVVSGGAFWKPPQPTPDVWAVNPFAPSGGVTPGDDEVATLPH